MPIALIALLVAAIAGVGFYVSRDATTTPTTINETRENELVTDNVTTGAPNETNEVNPEVETTTDPKVTPTESPSIPADVDVYKDGEYSATASYTDPGRNTHDIAVTLTIADDVITDASVQYNGGEASTPNHTRFENSYKSLVVGQSLESISLARVGGASLTTEAFNEAVASIKTEAKS